jgi:hypothetical protein
MSQKTKQPGAGPPAVLRAAPPVPRVEDLPKEVGVLLLAFGVLGLLLPGPIGTPALLAGGVVIWPGTFGRLSRWVERRYPRFHQSSNRQIGRFLVDLERRYPSSCG